MNKIDQRVEEIVSDVNSCFTPDSLYDEERLVKYITEARKEALQEALELVENLPKWLLEPTDPLLNWKTGQNERDELVREALTNKIESL